MNRDKAKRLLEMLRRRTEQRGATAAEAAQAAELAEKLIARFGLDIDVDTESDEYAELQSKVCPSWAKTLLSAFRLRFDVTVLYTREQGKRSSAVFRGPEHRCRVACWLFAAVYADLRRDADKEARRAKMSGSDLVRWRNQFLEAAALVVYRRLNEAHVEAMLAKRTDDEPVRHTIKAGKRKTSMQLFRDLTAQKAGAAAGKSVQLSTDVLSGEENEPLLLGHNGN